MTWLGIAAAVFIGLSSIAGYYRGFVKEAVSLMFVLSSIIIVWMIDPYVTDFLKEHTPVCDVIRTRCQESISDHLMEQDGLDETSLIAALPLPDAVKKGISSNNNSDVYRYLAVETFAEYIADYLAVMITNGIGFLISYFLATAGIQILSHYLRLMARLPILRGINRLAGGGLGFLKGVLVVWVVLLVMTVLCNTEPGKQCMALIERDPVLTVLYDSDVLVQVFLSIFYG